MNVLAPQSATAKPFASRAFQATALQVETSRDQVTLQDSKEPSLVYKAARALVGGASAIAMGTLGAAVGGVTNSGDTVIPAKVQHLGGKVLRPALAMVGAAVGILVGLSALPLGPVAGALAGTVAGAVLGGALPGAIDAFAASAGGAVKGLVQGVEDGWHGSTTAMDKIAAKFHHYAPAPAPASVPKPAEAGAQMELPFR